MQAAIWLIGLFAAAVALALFAGDNPGSVTVFWPPHRIDLSVNLALLLLGLLLLVLYASLRALTALLRLPRQARRWRTQQRERTTASLLLEAQAQLRAGGYSRARRQAGVVLARLDEREAQAPEPGAAGQEPDDAARLRLRVQAQLIAAEAAWALQDGDDARRQLDLALAQAQRETAPAELQEAVLLQAARWALQDGDAHAAEDWLACLSPAARRRVAARRLQLQLARQRHDADEVAHLERQLARRGLPVDRVGGGS